MGLRLRSVPPSHGGKWLREGIVCFLRRPLGFTALFLVYLSASLLIGLLPLVGGVLSLATVPLLSLAFMRATQEVLQGRAVRASHLLAVWHEPPAVRRAMLLLCIAFGLALTLGIKLVTFAIGAELSQALQPLGKAEVSPQELIGVITHPAVRSFGNWVAVWMAVVSVPFWHALALMHWGGQSAIQALFSSTLALWRSKGAFAWYCLSWMGCAFAVSLVASLAAAFLSLAVASTTLPLALAMLFAVALSAAFYVSLWFMFSDTFGVDATEGLA